MASFAMPQGVTVEEMQRAMGTPEPEPVVVAEPEPAAEPKPAAAPKRGKLN